MPPKDTATSSYFGRKQLATWLFCSIVIVFLSLTDSAWNATPVISVSMLISGYYLVRLAISGRAWTCLYLAGYKKNQLVTTGPYALSRNPLYLYTFIGMLGIALVARSFILCFVVLAWFAVFYRLVIAKEERSLKDIHGASFESYCATTPRFIPRFADKIREREEYIANPLAYRNRLKDFTWLIWGLCFVSLFSFLHINHLLPELIQLY